MSLIYRLKEIQLQLAGTVHKVLQNGALHVSSDQTDQGKLKSTNFIHLRR